MGVLAILSVLDHRRVENTYITDCKTEEQAVDRGLELQRALDTQVCDG